MQTTKTIIRVRRGIKTRYCACDNAGNPIQGFHKLSDIRKHWQKEIKWGYVELVRELDKTPDMETIRETKRMLETILRAYEKMDSKKSLTRSHVKAYNSRIYST